MEIIRNLADKLFETFYVDEFKYGVQKKDGTYRYVSKRIGPFIIENMLYENGSLLVYQEIPSIRGSLVKWLCFDIDIDKNLLEENFENYESDLLIAVELVQEALDKLSIPYLTEFSGRRGIHIWILLDNYISKAAGYFFVDIIYKSIESKLAKGINIDLFPKTEITNKKSKGVGSGVKLPLSINKKSGNYSYFINTLPENLSDLKIDTFSNEEFTKQLSILNNLETCSVEKIECQVSELLTRYTESQLTNNSYEYNIKSFLTSNFTLKEVINKLSACDHLKIMFDGYQKELTVRERKILVGLLINIESKEDSNLGYDLLLELFSQVSNFNEKVTREKLNGLKYLHPISCDSLGRCSTCNSSCTLNSPLELLEGISVKKLTLVDFHKINENTFNNLKRSLIKYSISNDEVPLLPHLKTLESITIGEFNFYLNQFAKKGKQPKLVSYQFERNENRKVRLLYNIDPINNLISTYFIYILNSIFYNDFSNHSYGYEFSDSLYMGNLYTNWFVNWGKYCKEVESVLLNDNYDSYFLVKIDIRSFYDSVNLSKLKIKLFEEAPAFAKSRISKFSEEDLSFYQSIIAYLLSINENILGNKMTGLSQGPAYSRILAEIYLIELDRLIESELANKPKRTFYNRFVDDIFIFLEDEDEANRIFKRIKDWLNINYLDLNASKSKVTNVRDFRDSGEYSSFKENQKYSLNRANKNKSILTEVEIQQALNTLESFANDAELGLKDNLRFFFGQFKDENKIKTLKRKLTKKIPFSTDGRGALYLIFYRDFHENYFKEYLQLADEVNKLSGLSLLHYLNSVLSYLKTDEIDKNFIEKLITNCINIPNLPKAGKLLLNSLVLNFEMNNKPTEHNDPDFLQALEQPGICLKSEHWTSFQHFLVHLDNFEFLLHLEKLIHEKDYDLEFLNTTSIYVFDRLSEWSDATFEEVVSCPDSLIRYYHVISFFTLFFGKKFNIAIIGRLWRQLNIRSSAIELIEHNIDLNWINKLDKFNRSEFSNAIYSILFYDKSSHSEMSMDKCPNNLLERYRDLLVIYLFQQSNEAERIELKGRIEENFKPNELSTLYKWIKDPNTGLYPKLNNIGIKNISENGLIVLNKNNEYFVRYSNSFPILKEFDYIKTDNTQLEEITYSLNPQFLFDSLKRCQNFEECIKNIYKIIEDHLAFQNKYKGFPILYAGYEIAYQNNPAVPYYSKFEYFIDSDGATKINDIENYFTSFLQFIEDRCDDFNFPIVEGNNDFIFTVNQLQTHFFPQTDLITRAEDKILFLNYFTKNIQPIKSIFDFQYIWSLSLYQYLEYKHKSQKIDMYFKIHFDHFKDENLQIDIFWSVVENFNIKYNNLDELFEILNSSIEFFEEEIEIEKSFSFKSLIKDYLPKINIPNVSLDRFKEIELETKPKRNKKPIEYIIDNNRVEQKQIYVYEDIVEEFIEASDEIIDFFINKKTFICKNEDKFYIYLLPKVLNKGYERVKNRLGELNEVDRNDGLFPKQNSYYDAKMSLEKFPKKMDLLNKIRTQRNCDYSKAEKHLIKWLTIFNLKIIKKHIINYTEDDVISLREVLLEIINCHSSISDLKVKWFINKLESLRKEKDNLIISFKNPLVDYNGLHNLLLSKNNLRRELDLTVNFKKLLNNQIDIKHIYVISDCLISGKQTSDSINYYFNLNLEQDAKDEFFKINSLEEKSRFKKNLLKVNKITFLAPLIGEKAKDTISAFFNELGFSGTLSFDTYSDKLLTNSEVYYKNATLAVNAKEKFNIILKNKELMKDIFEIPNDEQVFLGKIDKYANIILRVESMPKKHFKLFTYPTLKTEGLFKYRKDKPNI